MHHELSKDGFDCDVSSEDFSVESFEIPVNNDDGSSNESCSSLSLSISESELYNDSNSDIEVDTDVLVSISSEIAAWAVNHRIPRVSMHNLRRHNLDVPKDPRTLLKTPRSVVSDNIANGTYIYLGVKQGIIRTLKTKEYSGEVIKLIINIDGLPLYKSSSTTVWPILGMFGAMDQFIIALYCGKGKPTDLNAYLRDFCDEAEILKQNGIDC